jgi:putative transposase
MQYLALATDYDETAAHDGKMDDATLEAMRRVSQSGRRLLLVTGRELNDLTQLNTLFTAWVETVYHRRVHSETGQTPLQRWSTIGTPVLPTPQQLREAFLWCEHRTVTKTATVNLHGNLYEVDTALVGRRVELVFDPFDLTTIAVRVRGVPAGTAIPHRIGRHSHLKARPETPPELPSPTGIDYVRLLDRAHQTQLGDPVNGVNYAALAATPTSPVPAGSVPAGSEQLPGQLDLLTDLRGDTDLRGNEVTS